MLQVLESDSLKATISHKGAELLSLCSLRNGREYIWNGNESIWKWHAPVLFPQCGSFPDGYMHQGKRRFLPIHGFLRDMEHQYQGNGVFSLSFSGSDEYPFSFEALTSFILEGSCLIHRVEIKNSSSSPLPCSLGFHTGYAVSRARIEFEGEEEEIGSKYFKCSDENLREALLLTGIKSRTFMVEGEEGKRIRISSPHFSTLVIWSPKGHSSDLVCIEPRLDTVPQGGEKPFRMEIEKGHTVALEERIEILE
ncbi:MAG: hypothetical protein ACI4M4_08665 [Candidatus Ornithospirochaeta sp.]